MADESRPGILTPTISLSSLILILLAIPLVMEWQDLGRENVQMVGRVCVGLALLLAIYGVITHLFRILVLFAGAAITLTLLVAEGVIRLPEF